MLGEQLGNGLLELGIDLICARTQQGAQHARVATLQAVTLGPVSNRAAGPYEEFLREHFPQRVVLRLREHAEHLAECLLVGHAEQGAHGVELLVAGRLLVLDQVERELHRRDARAEFHLADELELAVLAGVRRLLLLDVLELVDPLLHHGVGVASSGRPVGIRIDARRQRRQECQKSHSHNLLHRRMVAGARRPRV